MLNRHFLCSKQKALGLRRRFLASASKYAIGENVHGFTINNVQSIPEFSLTAVHLKHSATGSEHLHLDSKNDTNNVFLIAFKTNPPDATGVPHILEHTTLCGSTKYPVRDPFFKMTNRSLSNFMNAMTGHDYTYYPFATTNAKDFENLMDVYLSSVFQPLLTYNDFTQEGWRLENSTTDDPSSDITFKGVVYNEMKGQNSNSAYYFYIRYLESIYPTLNNSGGNPESIVDLKYEQLREFHHRNYQPSNSKTFTYGSIPLENHLERLGQYLDEFKVSKEFSPNSDIKLPAFSTPGYTKEVSVPGPIDTMSPRPVASQYKSSITWNLGNPLDEANHYDVFKWKILSSLLCDGHSSPFYQELVESELGEDFAPNSGFDTTTALASFTLGLTNCSIETVNTLEEKILDIFKTKVLPELSDSSSFAERVEAILHQIELNLKKHKPDFGLGLLHSIIPSWINNVDPIKLLEVETVLTQFKNDYKENGMEIFRELLDKSVFNENVGKFKFTMVPDEQFQDRLAEVEQAKLKAKVERLSKEDREEIFQQGLVLAKQQLEEQDGSVLPTLTMEDIAKEGDFHPLVFGEVNGKKVQQRIVDTNGLVYVSALKDVSYLPTKYYQYLSLFSSCLTNLAGTSETSITELETKIQKLTGGISFNFRASPNPFDISQTKLQFSLSGMSLKENSSNIYSLWNEILTQTKLDANDSAVVDKLYQLIKNLGQNQLNMIADRGHSYSGGYSSSKLTATKHVSDIIGGMSQVKFVTEMNANLEKNGKDYLVKEVLPVLQEIKQLILDGTHQQFKYRLVGDKAIIEENEKLLQKFDESISKHKGAVIKGDGLDALVKKFNSNQLGINHDYTLINLPYQVGYASLAKLGSNYAHKDGASLQVLSQLMTFKHLHSVIRESNGAYGGGLLYDGLGGILNFYSYRDPNPVKSIESFKESFDYGKQAEWDADDLQQAKLRIFQSIDAPTNISSQGSTEFFDGITDEMRQERRENFLSVNNNDLVNVVDKYLLGNDKDLVTVIGDNKLLKVDEKWTVTELATS
ncbi:uncharacterized protein CANTADRAFT_52318 [Suhomyces tanzawaensis NRRL Y-17324]|uniref:Presequence protease, mitochondrial n=1 Tax=Suhomyces tanzawaensis NRRL Y-17324 TaxID=984487 RepID=A0A1E4SIN5_9ASCO|nr:uncharacterized protein CANTADRAFT_52318 [Suhomyces tanzawaensis NRRL Y-17324]ODV79292.1 hypothetical protein CANTADRAFT_52318 [Suhomyces tanzawaensis NRRL Y-17324]